MVGASYVSTIEQLWCKIHHQLHHPERSSVSVQWTPLVAHHPSSRVAVWSKPRRARVRGAADPLIIQSWWGRSYHHHLAKRWGCMPQQCVDKNKTWCFDGGHGAGWQKSHCLHVCVMLDACWVCAAVVTGGQFCWEVQLICVTWS